jgi:hypothetical protein
MEYGTIKFWFLTWRSKFFWNITNFRLEIYCNRDQNLIAKRTKLSGRASACLKVEKKKFSRRFYLKKLVRTEGKRGGKNDDF